MSGSISVALAQVEQRAFTSDLTHYRQEVLEIIKGMPDQRMVIHPELHLFGCQLETSELRKIAQSIDGDYVRSLGGIAAEFGIWLIPGTIVEPAPDGGVFNTALVFNPAGELVTNYRKIFPWRPSEPFTPGNDFKVFDVAGVGRFGITICYDIWFPEVVRQLTWMGSGAIINLVRTTTPDRKQELVLLQATSIMNQVYLLSVNAAAPVAMGRSLVVDPDGEIIEEVPDDKNSIIYTTVEFERVEQIRREGTAGSNRMWEQFLPNDAVLELPIYEGRIDPRTWRPREVEKGR